RGCQITSSAATDAATTVGHPFRGAAALRYVGHPFRGAAALRYVGHRFSGAAALERQNPRIDSSRAVADLIAVHAELIQQRQMQIRERHVLESDVAAALEMSGAAAGKDHRNVDRRVAVAVGDAS